MARSSSGESVVERVVRLLEQFGPATPELTITSLAHRADLPVATTHRLVGMLAEHGLLERTEDRKVRIGIKLWEISRRSTPELDLTEVARPFIEELHSVVGHHVAIGVLDGDDILYLERIMEKDSPAIDRTRVAGRLPAHAVSSGLVLIAFAPREVRERFLASPLAQVTDRTITDPDQLRRVLADIRQKGYCIAPGYVEPTGMGIGAPIRSASGEVIAGLSVTAGRADNPQRLVPAVLTTARGITRALGAQSSLQQNQVIRTYGH